MYGNLGQFASRVRASTKEPGKIFIPAMGEAIKLVDWREDPVYDTVSVGAVIGAGTEYIFFRDITNKQMWQTNLKSSSRLPADWELIVWRVGIEIYCEAAFDDVQAICGTTYFELKISDIIYAHGPTTRFPAGFGLTCCLSGTTDDGMANNGVPSPGAVPAASIPIHITHNDDIRGMLKFDVARTLSAAVYVRCYLYGWIKRPVR